MTEYACSEPVPGQQLLDYWLSDLPPADEALVEAHVFSCSACAARLDQLATLALAIRQGATRARPRGGTTRAVLDRLAEDRLVIRDYHLQPGDTIQCTVGRDDDFVVLYLAADLTGVDRVTLVFEDPVARSAERAEELPVVDGREVVWAEPADNLRPLGPGVLKLQLLVAEPRGERVAAEYTLNHTPFSK